MLLLGTASATCFRPPQPLAQPLQAATVTEAFLYYKLFFLRQARQDSLRPTAKERAHQPSQPLCAPSHNCRIACRVVEIAYMEPAWAVSLLCWKMHAHLSYLHVDPEFSGEDDAPVAAEGGSCTLPIPMASAKACARRARFAMVLNLLR